MTARSLTPKFRSLRAKSRSVWVGAFVSRLRSKRTGFVLIALALAACGSREQLRPEPGESLPPKPAAAETVPTPEELMTPSTQARPERSDELLRRSEQRQDDRFDLPPPG